MSNMGRRRDRRDEREARSQPSPREAAAPPSATPSEAVRTLTREELDRAHDTFPVEQADVTLTVHGYLRLLATARAGLDLQDAAQRAVEAWDKGWDCSADPGHARVSRAINALDAAIDAARQERGSETPRCSNCGQLVTASACGPSHAMMEAEYLASVTTRSGRADNSTETP